MSAVQTLPLGQHLIELVLAEHRAQGGLRELARRRVEILHLHDRLLGVQHPEVDHRVDLHRNIVPGDHILSGHIEHPRAQIHPHDLLHAGDEEDDAPGP